MKKIFRIIRRPLGIIKRAMHQFFIFVVPNLSKIKNKKIHFAGKYPNCSQLTKITGKGTVTFGVNCSFGFKSGGFHHNGMIELQPRYNNAKIILGNNISTNNNLFFCAANYIEIGDNTLIGQYVTIMDYEAHGIDPLKRREIGEIGKVIIGKNVWIGNNVTILKNTEVGENSIIATGAVVSGKFPANVVIGGVPAKIIKEL